VQLVGKAQEVAEKQTAFFKLVFGQNTGTVCLAFIHRPTTKFREEFYKYPHDLDRMVSDIASMGIGQDVYFCPQLLNTARRLKENVSITPSAWADLDTCNPDLLKVKPSVIVETSDSRWQGLWMFDGEVDPDDAEDLSRRIAYFHAEQGADRSGWDLTQLLRVPETYNYKYQVDTWAPVVSVTHASRARYRLSDFEAYPAVAGYKQIDEPMPSLGDVSAEDLLVEFSDTLSATALHLFNEVPEKDWSKPLWNLQMLLFEAGMTKEQVFTVVQEAKCNKYLRDGKSSRLLWKEVVRAYERGRLGAAHVTESEEPEVHLLSEEERNRINELPPTFVERYIEWAKSLGDAAPQYHQAGAFTILSALLCGSVSLPTSYGTLVPNLWFMILADTTLTRKSTSMDLAMDLAEEVDEDILLATDGSLEGLLGVLGGRPNTPSVFLRDEFSGLLELITKRDYYAGMAELLTKLYDGKTQKRVLRKEVVEVKQPRLLVYAGGIKNKICSLLTFEHVSSGFMPRFVFITAESDLNKIRPIGPPVTQTRNGRQEMIDELTKLYNRYHATHLIKVEKLKAEIQTQRHWEARMAPETWTRYNEFEATMLEAGLHSKIPEIMTPVHDRLAKSVLKAATLIAAAETTGEDVEITMDHLLRAIAYGEQWRLYAVDVMMNVGKSIEERQLDLIHRAIVNTPKGLQRSLIMQRYHLNARQMTQIVDTLEQRGLIKRIKQGKAEIYQATSMIVEAS
jgi:predicted transcriptional regulator